MLFSQKKKVRKKKNELVITPASGVYYLYDMNIATTGSEKEEMNTLSNAHLSYTKFYHLAVFSLHLQYITTCCNLQ